MTKQELIDRIKTLETERTNTVGMYEGAIQDCRFWLSKLEEAEKPSEEPKQENGETNPQ
jgi:hypothetical protein